MESPVAIKEYGIVDIVTVLMAGGVGNRLWPYSTAALPKQFLPLVHPGESLLQTTWKRILNFADPQRVLVLTSAAYVDIVAEQLPDLPREHIIGEPVMRNTAAAIALATVVAQRRWPGSVHVVLPCDHEITPEGRFTETVQTAIRLCGQDDKLYTIGIRPTRPSPEYGYICSDNPQLAGDIRHYDVLRFVEKPDTDTARTYLDEGGYFWNAGIFVWRDSGIMNALNRCLPDHVAKMNNAVEALDRGDMTAFERYFASLETISIDYAVMQPAGADGQVGMVEGDFYWNDLGGWDSLHSALGPDHRNNSGNYPQIFHQSDGCMVFSADAGHRFVLHGMQDIAVIHTETVTVVTSRKNLAGVPALKQLSPSIPKNDDDI